ncbi:hypothetical protein DIPPA_03956 [Diplonema papillatum]|nr:hypothetical protein DIPPA_03956 [Diplonema papillatum]
MPLYLEVLLCLVFTPASQAYVSSRWRVLADSLTTFSTFTCNHCNNSEVEPLLVAGPVPREQCREACTQAHLCSAFDYDDTKAECRTWSLCTESLWGDDCAWEVNVAEPPEYANTSCATCSGASSSLQLHPNLSRLACARLCDDAQPTACAGFVHDEDDTCELFANCVSTAASCDFTLYLSTTTSTPGISPSEPNHVGSVEVSLIADPALLVFYTTNGVDPTAASTPFVAPFNLTTFGNVTVKAIAYMNTNPPSQPSEVRSVQYNIAARLREPVFSSPAGDVAINVPIYLSSVDPGVVMHYVVCESSAATCVPPFDSAPHLTLVYNTATGITLSLGQWIVKAVAVRTGDETSDVATASFAIKVKAEPPVLLPLAGTVERGSSLSLTRAGNPIGSTEVRLRKQFLSSTTPAVEQLYSSRGTAAANQATVANFSDLGEVTVEAWCTVIGYIRSDVVVASYTVLPEPQVLVAEMQSYTETEFKRLAAEGVGVSTDRVVVLSTSNAAESGMTRVEFEYAIASSTTTEVSSEDLTGSALADNSPLRASFENVHLLSAAPTPDDNGGGGATDDEDDESLFEWWWILVGVGACCCLLVMIVVFMRASRATKKDEAYFGQEDDMLRQAGFSARDRELHGIESEQSRQRGDELRKLQEKQARDSEQLYTELHDLKQQTDIDRAKQRHLEKEFMHLKAFPSTAAAIAAPPVLQSTASPAFLTGNREIVVRALPSTNSSPSPLSSRVSMTDKPQPLIDTPLSLTSRHPPKKEDVYAPPLSPINTFMNTFTSMTGPDDLSLPGSKATSYVSKPKLTTKAPASYISAAPGVAKIIHSPQLQPGDLSPAAMAVRSLPDYRSVARSVTRNDAEANEVGRMYYQI